HAIVRRAAARAQRRRGRAGVAGPRRSARHEHRRYAPRVVHRRRPGRREPDRLHRLLLLGRRPDPRANGAQPGRHADCRLPHDDPLGGGRPDGDRPLPGRRRARSPGVGRRARGHPTGGRRRRRGTCDRAAGAAGGAGGLVAVLGPRAAQGRAAAVMTVRDEPEVEARSGAEPNADKPGRLVELSVRDLALIERLRLELEPGLNVLTGETGAGKSLLIDALGLALGARADTNLVRHGAEVARVEALFDRAPEPLIASREISAGGRSTARLDDAAVTAARLAENVGPLVEIHGQHEQSRLLDERWQLELLDAYAGHAGLRAEMARAVERWRENRRELADLAIE